MRSWLERIALAAFALILVDLAQARTLTVGVLDDGPAARPIISAQTLAIEANAVLGDPSTIAFPEHLRLDGGWTPAGVERALDQLERDPEVDIVVTIGFIASHFAGQRQNFPKPTIAALVVDPVLQGFPVAAASADATTLPT
jgi:hypothetical protein